MAYFFLFQATLPEDSEYRYRELSFTNHPPLIPDSDAPNFNAIYRVNISSKEKCKEWLERYKEVNKVELKIRSSGPWGINLKCVFQKDYHKKPETSKPNSLKINKFIGCPCKVLIRFPKRKDKDGLDMKVTVNFGHNHYINCSDFLRHKNPFRKVKKL